MIVVSDTLPIEWERVNPAKRDDEIENLWFYKYAAPTAIWVSVS